MTEYEKMHKALREQPKNWLVTGAAGFIGSNIIKELLKMHQAVIGLDNLSTGRKANIDEALREIETPLKSNFSFINGDICDIIVCQNACKGVDVVLHQAALGSVPRSINDPIATHENNTDGFLNMLVAARDAKVKRFVYASSSSVYGDQPDLPRVESKIGQQLSPYAVSKYVGELYARVFNDIYGLECIGLRYFNIFGPCQDPQSTYAAVIPLWFASLLRGEPVYINGDGKTSRDFCYVKNAVQANILAGCVTEKRAINQVYNIACSKNTSLLELFYLIRDLVAKTKPEVQSIEPIYRDFRQGDVRHSLADIGKAARLLGYQPQYLIKDGLKEAADWYIRYLGKS